MMTFYSQQDQRWALVKIGSTRLLMRDWGCALTGAASLLSYYGVNYTPGQLARMPRLTNKNGEIIWGELARISGNKMRFVWRQYGRDDQQIKASVKNSPKTSVMLQVNNKKHWVVVLSVTPDGKDYMIMDCLDGKKKQLFKTYPNITGSAHFTS